MNAAASTSRPQPVALVFELDRRRIQRALRERVRYRYVQPKVLREEGGDGAASGWRIVSPCCSRNVDPEGGEIDIAWLQPIADARWRLHMRDHKLATWVPFEDADTLTELLDTICLDPTRVFWP
jgi:hypothetical protein